LGKRQPGNGEADRGREDEMMGNESKYHRRDAGMYLIERRTGDESGGGGGLKRRRSHKAEGLAVTKSI
jgi:hypothetical protein